MKKRKRADSDSDDDSSSSSSDSESEDDKVTKKKAKKEKKSKDKKEKKERKKAKKQKKKSKAKDTDSSSSDSDSDSDDEDEGKAAETNKPESWHVTDLDGGSARQSKFLRLLGGKKQGMSVPTGAGAAKTASDSTRAEADIRRQFEEGMKIKHDGGSHRRGLGM